MLCIQFEKIPDSTTYKARLEILFGKFDWQHLEVGLPMAFQFSITAIGTMVIQSALNSLGSTAVAAFTAGSKIDQFATQPLASLGVAVATYTAQNYGARKLERIKKGVTGAAIIATVCGIVGGFVVITFAKPLVALFVGSGQNEVMSLSKEYLVLNGVFYVILGLLFVYRNALQGIGSSMIAVFRRCLGTGYAFACCICACVIFEVCGGMYCVTCCVVWGDNLAYDCLLHYNKSHY